MATNGYVTGSVFKWTMGIALTMLLAFAGYVVGSDQLIKDQLREDRAWAYKVKDEIEENVGELKIAIAVIRSQYEEMLRGQREIHDALEEFLKKNRNRPLSSDY